MGGYKRDVVVVMKMSHGVLIFYGCYYPDFTACFPRKILKIM